MTWELTPVGWAFLMAGALALIGITLVLIFDRPKTPKAPHSEGKGPPQQP